MAKEQKMTEKQKRFADEYIISANATDAAKKAGYSDKAARQVGSENLSKPYIKKYINVRLKKLEEESIAEQKEIMQTLTSISRGELSEKQVVAGSKEAIEVPTPLRERIKALELLGKRYSMWTDKVDANVTGNIYFVDDVPLDDND